MKNLKPAHPSLPPAYLAPDYLFIYGTLLTGTGDRQIQRHLQRYLQPVGAAVMAGRLYDLGAYPGMVCSTRDGEWVQGMLCTVHRPERGFNLLDRYEECESENISRGRYGRHRKIARLLTNNQDITCWVYLYQGSITGRPRIRHGDYRRFLGGNDAARGVRASTGVQRRA